MLTKRANQLVLHNLNHPEKKLKQNILATTLDKMSTPIKPSQLGSCERAADFNALSRKILSRN